MIKLRTTVSSAATMVFALLLIISVPAFAQNGSDDTTEHSGSTETTSTTTPTTSTSGRRSAERAATSHEEVATLETEHTMTANDDTSEDVHTRGAKLLAEAKSKHKDKKEKTAEERKKVCEAHKDGLTNKFSHISTNSDKIQAKIDASLVKAQAYKTSSNITLANYDDLLSAASTAQTNSVASIAAMKAVQPSVDCNNISVAGDVATFKAAAQTTRDNLKTYRTATKALLTALAGVKTETTTTTGDN